MILESSFTPLVLLTTGICLIAWRYVLYRAFISPLAKVPCAHWSARFSPVWILWTRYTSREIRTIHESHQKYGPVIRLSPKELSVNCVEGGIKTVYTGGFEKHDWYARMFDNYG
jgi:hypothetical protein